VESLVEKGTVKKAYTVVSKATAEKNMKVPVSTVWVGSAPSPNLKAVRSKIRTPGNMSYEPGRGNVDI
jgi:microtubule-associated protein tau